VATYANGTDLNSSQETTQKSPKVGDWFEAEWFDNIVKIPLTIQDSSIWYANLIASEDNGQGIQDGGKCMIDCNSATTLIFTDVKTGSPWFDSEDALCSDT